MLQQLGLPARCGEDMGMAVTAAYRDNPSEAVEVPAALFVKEPLALSFDDHQRLLVVMEEGRVQKLTAQPQ